MGEQMLAHDFVMQSNEYQNEKREKKAKLVRGGFQSDGRYGIPLIKKQDIDLSKIELWCYTKAKANDKENEHKTIHFYTYDWLFESVFTKPEVAMEKLDQYYALLTPDFSTYKDMPLAVQMWSVFKSRWCGAYWQRQGMRVIPTVTYAAVKRRRHARSIQTRYGPPGGELSSGQSQDLAKCEEEIIICQKRILELFRRKREGTILSGEYDRDYKEYSEKVMALQAEQAKLKEQNFEVQLARQRLMEIAEVLSDKEIVITDETVMKMLIDYIKVNNKHEIEFEFKCGLTAKENL